jgi:hypothetical protein
LLLTIIFNPFSIDEADLPYLVDKSGTPITLQQLILASRQNGLIPFFKYNFLKETYLLKIALKMCDCTLLIINVAGSAHSQMQLFLRMKIKF